MDCARWVRAAFAPTIGPRLCDSLRELVRGAWTYSSSLFLAPNGAPKRAMP